MSAAAPLSPTMLDEEITDDIFLRAIESTTGARKGTSVPHYSEGAHRMMQEAVERKRTAFSVTQNQLGKLHEMPAVEITANLERAHELQPNGLEQRMSGWKEEKKSVRSVRVVPSLNFSSRTFACVNFNVSPFLSLSFSYISIHPSVHLSISRSLISGAGNRHRCIPRFRNRGAF